MLFDNKVLNLLILSCSAALVSSYPADCDTVLLLFKTLGGVTSEPNGCKLPGVYETYGAYVWKINWNGMNLNGYIHPDIGKLDSLKYLFLRNNQITGSIPSTIGGAVKLRRMNLEKNQLTGSIPTSIGSLTQLRRLWLRKNQLSGSIPKELGNLSYLRWLRLQFNQFSGSIPAELFSCTNLIFLNVRYNNLSGVIPNGIEKLTKLKELRMSYNQLSGNIPVGVGQLSSTYYIELNSNQLTGIPQTLVDLRVTKVLLPNPLSAIPYKIYVVSPAGTLSSANWTDFFAMPPALRKRALTATQTDDLLRSCPLNNYFGNADVPAGCIAAVYNKYCLVRSNLGNCYDAYNTVFTNSIFSSLLNCAAWKFGKSSPTCATAISTFRVVTIYGTLTSTNAQDMVTNVIGNSVYAPCQTSATVTCKP